LTQVMFFLTGLPAAVVALSSLRTLSMRSVSVRVSICLCHKSTRELMRNKGEMELKMISATCMSANVHGRRSSGTY
jgi:hypothetical protein